MFDIQVTIKWVTGLLQNATETAQAYQQENFGWQQSFVQITLPVYVLAFVVGGILALANSGNVFGGFGVALFMFTTLWALAWTFVIAFVFNFFADKFTGEEDFDRAYGLVALAIIPSAIGSALSSIPWIGWLISLGLGVYSMMLAYQFVPIFLKVEEDARIKHFAASMVTALIINIVVTAVLGSIFISSVVTSEMLSGGQNSTIFSDSDEASSAITDTGMFGSVGRQAKLAQEADADSYAPPSDGELSDQQVASFVRVLDKTSQLRERLSKKFADLDEDNEPSISDVLGGVGDAMRLSTAEMEVVKSGGGNWAEHQWVRQQLEIARIQQDLNAATEHNFALFLRYQDEIEANE